MPRELELDQMFDEVAALQEQERKRLLADAEPAEPGDLPATKIVKFKWYDRTLGRYVEEPFEIRLLSYKERIQRARLAGLMAQVTWSILPEDTQQYLMALCTSNILWPKASASWKRCILEQDEIAVVAYMAVEAHRQEYFRRDDGSSGEDASALGLEILPVSNPPTDPTVR